MWLLVRILLQLGIGTKKFSQLMGSIEKVSDYRLVP